VPRSRHGIAVPYNEAIYEMCKREFARTKFGPMDMKQVWAEVTQKL
jgi:hypothetical protein